jgi:hypothetical protein
MPLVREEYSVDEGTDLGDEMFVRSLCSRAWDCGRCSLMHEWVRGLATSGWAVGWECVGCLKDTRREDEENGGRVLPGFYQAGRRFDRTPDDPEFDKDRPALEGCTRCGWESSLLQLVLRRGGR